LTTGVGNGGFVEGPAGEVQRRQVESFLLASPTNLAPIVGQQITLTAENVAVVGPPGDLLRQPAEVGECDLVVQTPLFRAELGFVYLGSNSFESDRQASPHVDSDALRSLATDWGRPLTYTCVPPGSGVRVGVDRDGDGFWDGDERDAGSDPADPTSTP